MESKQQGTGIHQQFPERRGYHQDSWNLSISRDNALNKKPQVGLLRSTNASEWVVPCITVGWTLQLSFGYFLQQNMFFKYLYLLVNEDPIQKWR